MSTFFSDAQFVALEYLKEHGSCPFGKVPLRTRTAHVLRLEGLVVIGVMKTEGKSVATCYLTPAGRKFMGMPE
jgi:hypothetical protein